MNVGQVSDSDSESDEESGPSWQKQPGIDLARGEGNVETSSSDSDSEEEADQGGVAKDVTIVPLTDELDHRWGEMDADAPRDDATSHRLAVCNIDWDSVSASDLYMLFNSFKPTGGVLHSVKVT